MIGSQWPQQHLADWLLCSDAHWAVSLPFQTTELLIGGLFWLHSRNPANPSQEQEDGERTPLHFACAFGHWDVVAFLLEKKCNLELLDNEYNTPLIKAAERQHFRCVNLLLDNGANPNVQDPDGYSPLHNAVFSRTTAMAEKLLSHNANMELQNKDGHTPLLLALKHNRQKVAALLIHRKANIHAVDKEKRTALILAAKYNAKGIVELLLREGIDAFAEDQSGKNALSHAIASGFNVKIILAHTRAVFNEMQARKAVGGDSSTRFAEEPGAADTKPTSEESNNKSDTKNVPEEKESVCGDVQQSKKADESSKNETLTRESGSVEDGITNNVVINKSDAKTDCEGKGEVSKYFWQSKNDAKCDQDKEENQASHDNNDSHKGAECIFWTAPARRIKAKSLHGTPPSSPDMKTVCEEKGEVHKYFWQSKKDAKHDQEKHENQASGDNSDSDRVGEHIFWTAPSRRIKFKRLHGTPPSSPDMKTVREGKGEVRKYFWQSRNDANYDQNKQENRSLLDSSGSDNETENVVWNTCAKYMKVKSLHGTLPTSRGKKSVSEPLPLSCVGKFTVAEDQRAEQKINKHKEDDLGTSSHRSTLRTANIAQPDDARNVGTLVSNAAPHVEVESENHQRRLSGPEKKQSHKICESPSLSCVGHLSAPSDQRQKRAVSVHIKGDVPTSFYMNASSDLNICIYIRNVNASGSCKVHFSTAPRLEITSDEEQNTFERSESNQLLVEEKKMKHPIETKESQNLCEGTEDTDYNDEPMEQRKSRKNDHEPFSLTKSQEHDGAREKACNSKRKVKTTANAMENFDNLSKSCQTASEDCELAYPNDKEILQLIEQHKTSCKDSVSLSKIEDAVISSQRTMEHRKCHCSQCSLFTEKFTKMETKVCELKIKLSDAKKVNAMLEHEKAEWKQELSNLRCELQEEEKKRKNADHLLKKIKEQLREKEEDYNKEMEIKRQLEMALKTRDMELNTERKKLKQDIEILKGKYDDLQKTIKEKEETAGANPFQDNEQFNKMKDEITTLKFQLEYEKENRERLETEFKSYRATLAAAPFHHYEGHTSKGYQEFDFQSAREEYLRSQAKMMFAISYLKAHSEVVSKELLKNEERFCILKNKVHQIIHAVKEITLNLETLHRDLRQAQCQIKKIKYTYHNEQTKVNKYDGKQDSIEERSQPQTENTLLQQQLHKPHNKSVNKDTVLSIQHQSHDIVEKLRAEIKNHNLILENMINKFSNKFNRIEERRNQYENEKTERTVAVRPLQQERASLEVSSDCHLNLEEETQELRRN